MALCADENKMTTPTTTRKICTFFFTGLDRSCLTNLDLSRTIVIIIIIIIIIIIMDLNSAVRS